MKNQAFPFVSARCFCSTFYHGAFIKEFGGIAFKLQMRCIFYMLLLLLSIGFELVVMKFPLLCNEFKLISQ